MARTNGRPAPRTGGVNPGSLVVIRWVTIVSQAILVTVAAFGFGLEIPMGPATAAIGVSVMVNVAAILHRQSHLRLSDRDAALYLVFDLTQLAVLLFFTGGLQNPFAILLLGPLAISATILSRRSTLVLMLLTISAVSVLALWHNPLPGAPRDGLPGSTLYTLGSWVAIMVLTGFIALSLWNLAEEARRLRDAVAASQMALDRAYRISAIGTLAAATAHRLGTPLSTIAVIAREMQRDLPPDSPLREDAELLTAEARRCSEILGDLARDPDRTDDGSPLENLAIPGLVEEAARPYGRDGIHLHIDVMGNEGNAPKVRPTPELVHGLGTLLQNALQFASSAVQVKASWSPRDVMLEIEDDGPGFPPSLLARIGEPYISGRRDRRGHMGLGIFIATSLLERAGARLVFGNRPEGGARVKVTWPRAAFELGGE